MLLNRTISSLALAKIFNGSPFRTTQTGETLKVSKSIFSKTLDPLFFVKRGSHLSLSNTEFRNIGSSIVKMDASITYEKSLINQLIKESVDDVNHSSIIIQNCKFINVKFSNNLQYLAMITSSPTLIYNNTFASISLKMGLFYIIDSSINITQNVITNCNGAPASLFNITSCSGTVTDNNITQSKKSTLIFVDDVTNISFNKLQVDYSYNKSISAPVIDIQNSLEVTIDSLGISTNSADSNAIINMKNVTRATIFAAAFINISKPVEVSSFTALILKRWCTNAITDTIGSSEDSIIANVSGKVNLSTCSYENIIIHLATATPPLSTSEKIAMYITIAFFCLFFISTFIILISLIFCKVGMSQEIQFSEEMGEEEDSFVSFAN